MPALNTRQAQVIDPILSTQARGYANQEFIGTRILPYADIPNRSMKVIRFGKDAFRRYMDTRRAPGAETKRVQFGYASDPVALKQEALEALVPDEISGDAQRVPGINLASTSIQTVQDIIALGREVEIAALVQNAALYPAGNKVALAGASKWSDASSDPADDIKAGQDAVRRMIGRKPNILTIGPDVFRALTKHPKIKDQFKYTGSDSITETMLAKYFNLEEVIVGNAVALPDGADDATPAVDVWGNNAILSYRPKGSNMLVPAFGYTYRLIGFPAVESPYYERNRKSWVYPLTEEYRPYVTGAEGGFLFQTPA